VLFVIMEPNNRVISAAKVSLKEPHRSSIANRSVDGAQKSREVALSYCSSDSVNVFLI